jgi:N-acetylglutamate synthase-like GNAT family acetyltransferase
VFSEDDNDSHASFVYGNAGSIYELLLETGRSETAEWLSDYQSRDSLVAWMTDIEVSKNKRRSGLGAELLLRGFRELSRMGVEMVFAHALADFGYQQKLERWYRSHGFTISGKHDGLTLVYTSEI